jgi:hypothetical protein
MAFTALDLSGAAFDVGFGCFDLFFNAVSIGITGSFLVA